MTEHYNLDVTKNDNDLNRSIRCLKSEIKRKNQIIGEKNEILRVMFNRCRALTAETMCGFCQHIQLCKDIKTEKENLQ